MAKNLTNFEDFQNKRKSANESKTNEAKAIVKQTDTVPVDKLVQVESSLLKAFVTKVQSESGQDIRKGTPWSDTLLARAIVDFVIDKLMIIDNLPVSIVTGEAQGQPVISGQAQAQGGQPTIQPDQNAQAPQAPQAPPQNAQIPPQAPPQGTQAQKTASQIPPTE